MGLYLMTSKGTAVLKAALESNVEISHVVTAPAAGMNDSAHIAIESRCKANRIPVFRHAAPPTYTADVGIAAGWRWLLDLPTLVVLHDSLLPRYRGFSPLVTALINGEPEIGVTAFLAREEPDTGPIIGQRAIHVTYPARVADVIDRLLPAYGELAHDVCGTVRDGQQLRYSEQDHAKATVSLWRDEADYRIDWTRDAHRICRLVDAVSDPFPGVTATLAGKPVRVTSARPAADVTIEDRAPGKILRLDAGGCPLVVCGTGLVRVTGLENAAGDSLLPLTRLKERFA